MLIFYVLQFGLYEWVMTDAWDPSNPEHKAIAHGIEVGDGIAEMRTYAQARKALKTVGFDVELDEDLAERPDEVPWYYPLEVNRLHVLFIFQLLIPEEFRVISVKLRRHGTT